MNNITISRPQAAESNKNVEKLDEAAQRYFEAPSHMIDEIADEVTNAAIPLILYYTRIYGGMLNREDLMQVGMEGLLKALRNYKRSFGTSFTTYASHCIIGEIRHLVRKELKYYTPGFIVDKQKKADEYILEYIKEFGEAPTNDQISQHIGIAEEGVPEIMRSKLVNFDSIDASKIKTIQYKTFKLPIEDRIVLWNAFKKISDMQKRVISLLFFEGYTQEETAKKLGTNQRQVSRIKQKGLEAMKKIIKEN
jgi:RNA polymerase sigma-B factor